MKTSDRTRLLYGRQKLTDGVLVQGPGPSTPSRKVTLTKPMAPPWGIDLGRECK